MNLMRLKALRTARNLRQADMAKSLKIDRTTYVKYETGASEPPLSTLYFLADFFGVSIDYIVGRSDVNLPENEAELLKIFRQLTPAAQAIVLGTAASALQQADTRQEADIPSAI